MLIAVAFGTTIAANYAIEHQGRVKGMVLAAWSELHEAMAYFHRWEKYNAQAADVLGTEGRDALISLLREQGGKTIYGVIPSIRRCAKRYPDVRQPSAQEYRCGMLEFGSSVPDLVPALRELDLPVLGLCGADDPYPDRLGFLPA